MSEAALRAVLQECCRELKTPSIFREYPELTRQARDAGWPYEEFLRELLDIEVRSRREHTAARRLREARFPDVKTLDQLDWAALPGVSRPKVLEWASCGYLEPGEDVVIAGPIGTGKTPLAIALGVEAIQRRHRVLFTRAADLVRDLREARDERTLRLMQQRLQRVELLVIDALGFVPFDRVGGALLVTLTCRIWRRSWASTTNTNSTRNVNVGTTKKSTETSWLT